MRYTTLFLDLDDTLLDFKRSENGAIREVLSMHSLPAGNREAEIYSAVNKSFWESFERGEIQRDEIFYGRFRKLVEILGLPANADAMARDYFGCLASRHDLVEGAMELLVFLREKGFYLCVTTNGLSKTQHRRVRESGIGDRVDALFVSEDIGPQKPDRAYFDYCIDHIPEKDRARILIIGDSPSSDIRGGENAGIDVCWYNPSGRTTDLKPRYEIRNLNELKALLVPENT